MECTSNNIYNKSPRFIGASTPWFQNKNFERFWTVYNKCMTYTHQDILSRCNETENKLAATLYKMVKAPWPENFSEFRDKTKISRKKKKRNRKKKNKAEKKKSSEQSVFVLTDDDTLQVRLQEQMKIEESSDVDEAYLAFLKTSVMHRIKWNEIKDQKTASQEDEETSHILAIEQGEHPDDVRDKEMLHLYGESAPQIYGMETAMQLSFDRISTLHQPTLWPCLPLALVF